MVEDDEELVDEGVVGLLEDGTGVDGADGVVGVEGAEEDDDEDDEPPLVGAPTDGAPPGPQAAMPTTAVALKEAAAIRARVVRMRIPFVDGVGNTTTTSTERFHPFGSGSIPCGGF